MRPTEILLRLLVICVFFVIACYGYGQYSSTTTDLDKNWIVSKSLRYDGSVKGINKQYFDNTGVPTQRQQRNMSAGQVIASQVLRDAYGRPVINTMAAPVNSSDFGYKANFILNSSGTAYNFLNFDDAKLNNPDPIGGQSVAGSLGWYYSDNNTLESRVATSSYPYGRTDFYKDGTGAAKRFAGVGDAYRMGRGKEIRTTAMPVINELSQYLQVRNKYFTTAELGAMPASLSNEARQMIATDINGSDIVEITDREGKTLMMGRPGSDLLVSNTGTASAMNYEVTLPFINAFSSYSSFSINNTTASGAIILNGSIVYNGALSQYTNPPPSSNYTSIVIKANAAFSINYQSNIYSYGPVMYKNIQGETKGTDNEIFYFKLINDAGSTVTVTPDATYGGTWQLYDMNTEQLVVGYSGSGTLARGYYKLVSLTGKVNISYTNGYTDISYRFYNQLGQMVAAIAPEGVKRLIQNLNGYPAKSDVPFMNTFEYDRRSNLIASTSSEGGRSEFVYRKDGKLRFSQNAQQQSYGWFSYTNYDADGRPTEGGEYHPSGDVTFTGLKTNLTVIEDVSSNGGLPLTSNKYEWIRIKYDDADNSHGQANHTQGFVRGKLSTSEGPDSKTWYSYDELGRITWVIRWINGLGYKTTDYVFDAEGRISTIVYQKWISSETFVHYYTYDEDGRLKQVLTNTSDAGVVAPSTLLQAKYIYYMHGSLKREEIAGNLQGLDYSYTLDGQLKAINHSDKTKDPGNDGPSTNGFLEDAFGEVLEYYPNDYARSGTNIGSIGITNTDAPEQYNGQIRGMSWFTKKPGASGVPETPTMYVFKYDQRYQFTEATWGSISANVFVAQAGVFKENITSYDMNGNIQALSRTNGSGTLTDNFSYSYSQSPRATNKLASITQQPSGQTYASYQYNNLGQLSAELPGAANGSSVNNYVQYHVNGKVKGVYSDVALSVPIVKFVYDELGRRIKKLSYNGSGVLQTTTYYVYGPSGNLMSIYDQQGAGAIVQKELPIVGARRSAVFVKSVGVYRYELTDHLGNVRAVFVKTVSNTIDVVLFRDYYPFGMQIPGRYYEDATGYRYGYQGQFSEKDGETGWNGFQLRMYDSRIARWLSVDPKGEFWSPYVAMGNDPLNLTDPDGGCAKCRAEAYAAGHDNTYVGTKNNGVYYVTYVEDGIAHAVYFGKPFSTETMARIYEDITFKLMFFDVKLDLLGRLMYGQKEQLTKLVDFVDRSEAETFGEMLLLSRYQRQDITLVGKAIDKIKSDPQFVQYAESGGAEPTLVTLGGDHGNLWHVMSGLINPITGALDPENIKTMKFVSNELSWMLRHAWFQRTTIDGKNAFVVTDVFDLRPDRSRDFKYQAIATVLDVLYHDIGGNSYPTVHATFTYP